MHYYKERGENIVAVDPKVIALGSKITYNDTVYTARDVGRLINGNKIDILVGSHYEATALGIMYQQDIMLQ